MPQTDRMRAVIGRERELAIIEGLLGHGRERFAALLLLGEAGIGKTTVWQEAVRLGEDAGFRVLRCRPAQAEAKLGFASLADLLSPVEEDALSPLPGPQRQAIEAALLRAAPGALASTSRAVAAGLLSVLRGLARESPVLLAIDDAQWLDRSSEAALAFALRRLDPEAPLVLVAAVRVEGATGTDALGFAALPAAHRERVVLGPLSLSVLYHVIHGRLGIAVPRPTLQRIEAASGGNPLLAVELARALDDAGQRPRPGEPLPVPDEISGLLAKRLTKLPERVREALLAAALLSDPTIPLVERAVGHGAERSLEEALAAELVEIGGDRIRFAHPLVGAVLVSSALPSRRRAMHRRLAEIVDSREERARHLALACEGPDAGVAEGLEDAAGIAERRGAPEVAAELLELASRLTPPDEAATSERRRLELARALARAGDRREATHVLDDLLAGGLTGPLRARALELRAHIHWVAGTAREAEACCEEALLHVGDDDVIRARVLVTLARVTVDVRQLRRRSLAALEWLESMDDPDPGLLSEALVGLAGAEYYLGTGIPDELVERALELERVAPPANVADRMSAALGTWLKYDGDFEGARYWLEQTRQSALDEGDEGSLPYALSHLPQLELWTGNWDRSEARALEHLELAERTGQEAERLTAQFSLALVHAHLGRVDEARERLEQAVVEAEQADPWNVYLLLSARGFLELSVGSTPEAVASLARALEIYEASGAGDTPAVFENYAEALVSAGDLETAQRVVDIYEDRARKAGKAIALAPACRSRALVLAAQQRLDEALASLEEAVSHHQRVEMPFSRARTQLLYGQILRRRGERRAARDALEQALAVFEGLGSPAWADRARAELGRIPIKRRSGDGLTATEARVAELVSQGKTNEQVAQELFVSSKTVEANLTRIYRKLGIRSRVALAARMGERDVGEEQAKA
jgi:DNA-binding CsgD family transcriptional regulator